MFHLSRTICFIACLLAAIFVAWWVGVIALIAAVVVIPDQETRILKTYNKVRAQVEGKK